MLEQLEMEVSSRDERGKNAARRLRAAGRVPATLYGLGQDPVSLALDGKAIFGLLSHREQRNRVLNLSGGASGTAMAIDWQVDPVEGYLLHVDLKRVDVDQPVEARVALKTKGVAYGVKTEGGLEDVILREALVRCKPADLPPMIEIDVTALRAGDSVRLGDLEAEGKYKILGNPTAVVVRIVGKRTGGADAAGGEAAPAEESAE
ncbi:MAG: 50S ribosomal protein L25 [Bryobacterales bacterium]|nr:50S ribosomal protein L25 [Acidobacteriota bacterium]MCB9385694.1 50S ribosomal protein L25 [Bryobacterales bacterium]